MSNTLNITLEIDGPFNQLVKLKDFVRSSKDEFSFDKIEPMPEELKGARASENQADQYQQYTIWLHENWGCLEPDFISCRIENRQFLRYSFHTKGTSPDPAILKLSSLFPEIIIVMYVEDELDGMRSASEEHRGLYGIPANVFCNGKCIQKFTHPRIDFYELRELAKEIEART